MVNKLTFDKKTNKTKGAVLSRYLKEADVYDQTSTIGICQAIKEQQNICTNGDEHEDDRESACKGDSGGFGEDDDRSPVIGSRMAEFRISKSHKND